MAMFLSRDEVRELTGYARRGAQIDWLRKRAWPFEIGGDGHPRLLRSAVLARLGGIAENDEPAHPKLRLPSHGKAA